MLLNFFRYRIGYGGSGVTKELILWVKENIPKETKIVELGAGKVSTRILSKRYKLISVEESLEYINLYSKVQYVFAPISENTNWYQIPAGALPQNYECLIIDGPSGTNRRDKVLDHLEELGKPKVIVVDDISRPNEYLLCKKLANELKMNLQIFKNFAVLRGNKDPKNI